MERRGFLRMLGFGAAALPVLPVVTLVATPPKAPVLYAGYKPFTDGAVLTSKHLNDNFASLEESCRRLIGKYNTARRWYKDGSVGGLGAP